MKFHCFLYEDNLITFLYSFAGSQGRSWLKPLLMKLIYLKDSIFRDEKCVEVKHFLQMRWFRHMITLKAVGREQFSDWLPSICLWDYVVIGWTVLEDHIEAITLVMDSHIAIREQIAQYPFMEEAFLNEDLRTWAFKIVFRFNRVHQLLFFIWILIGITSSLFGDFHIHLMLAQLPALDLHDLKRRNCNGVTRQFHG